MSDGHTVPLTKPVPVPAPRPVPPTAADASTTQVITPDVLAGLAPSGPVVPVAPPPPTAPVGPAAGDVAPGPVTAAEPLLTGLPVTGPPVSGAPVAGPPIVGPPVAGPPAAGPPVAGPPIVGPPTAGAPVAGSPVTGSPVAGAPAVESRPAVEPRPVAEPQPVAAGGQTDPSTTQVIASGATAPSFTAAAQTDLAKATTALDAVDKQQVTLDMDKQALRELLGIIRQARSLVDSVHTRAMDSLDVELQFGRNWVGEAISRRLRQVAVGDDTSAVRVIGDFSTVLREVEETIRDAARNLEDADDDAAEAFYTAAEEVRIS